MLHYTFQLLFLHRPKNLSGLILSLHFLFFFRFGRWNDEKDFFFAFCFFCFCFFFSFHRIYLHLACFLVLQSDIHLKAIGTSPIRTTNMEESKFKFKELWDISVHQSGSSISFRYSLSSEHRQKAKRKYSVSNVQNYYSNSSQNLPSGCTDLVSHKSHIIQLVCFYQD